jgi:hypothetical protein
MCHAYPMSDSETGPAHTRNLDRLIALVVGIFAVAMTLLVLDLKLPGDVSLTDGLRQILPAFLIYRITFVSIVGYWYMHHSTFLLRRRRSDDMQPGWRSVCLRLPKRIVRIQREGGQETRSPIRPPGH